MMRTDGYRAGVDLFRREWDNIRAALDHAIDRGDMAAAWALVESPFWYAYTYQVHELGEWAEHLLSAGLDTTRLRGTAAFWAFQAADLDAAERHLHAGIAMATSTSDPATTLCWMAAVSCHNARGHAEELRSAVGSYTSATGAEPDDFVASCHLALALLFPTFNAEPQAIVAEATRRGSHLGNPLVDTLVAVAAGIAEFVAGRRDNSASALRDGRRHAAHAGPFAEAIAVWTIAVRASAAGFGVDPATAYRDAIERTYTLGAWGNLFAVMESLAAWLAGTGRVEPAATALGYLEAKGQRLPEMARRRSRALALVLEDPNAPRWLAAGARLDRDQLVALVLRELAAIGAEEPAGATLAPPSPRTGTT
jgi:hypothetical protein